MFEVCFKPFDFQPTNMLYVMGEQELMDERCQKFVSYMFNNYNLPVSVDAFEDELLHWDIDPSLLSREQMDILDEVPVY